MNILISLILLLNINADNLYLVELNTNSDIDLWSLQIPLIYNVTVINQYYNFPISLISIMTNENTITCLPHVINYVLYDYVDLNIYVYNDSIFILHFGYGINNDFDILKKYDIILNAGDIYIISLEKELMNNRYISYMTFYLLDANFFVAIDNYSLAYNAAIKYDQYPHYYNYAVYFSIINNI